MFCNIPAENNVYTLKANADLKLYHQVGGTIPEFRAYFTLPESFLAKPLRVIFDDGQEPGEEPEVTPTGIREADTELLGSIFQVYSIDGRLMKHNEKALINLPKGVYIINGKKIIIK